MQPPKLLDSQTCHRGRPAAGIHYIVHCMCLSRGVYLRNSWVTKAGANAELEISEIQTCQVGGGNHEKSVA